ncbi:MAG: DUF6603 domain-containing protein [Candidatus Sulfotelmatobacter sp.]
MSNAGTVELIIGAIGRALAPLMRQLTPTRVTDLFTDLGLTFPSTLGTQPGFSNALSDAQSSAAALPTLLQQLSSDVDAGSTAAILTDGAAVLAQVAELLSKLDTLGNQLTTLSGSFPGIPPGDVTAFASNLSTKILSLMVVEYLESTVCYFVDVVAVAGLIDRHSEPGVPTDPSKPAFEVRQLRLDRLQPLLTSPADYLKTLYGWGSPTFDGQFLFNQLLELAAFLGLPAVLTPAGGGNPAILDLFAVGVQLDSTANPPGLRIDLRLPVTQNFTSSKTLDPTNWALDVQVTGNFVAGIVAQFAPPATASLASPSGTLSGQLEMQLSLKGADVDHPIILLGQTGGSCLQTDSISFGTGANVSWNSSTGKADVDPLVTFDVTGGKAVIDTSQADGFISEVTSGVNVEADFALKLMWSANTGIHFQGGAQLEIDLPLHLDLGPVTLPTLYLVAGATNSGITLEVSAALGLTLGPIDASVDRVGMLGTLTFPASGGNLGVADLKVNFKPPNGLGLSVDAGLVTGGGYITFDPSKGQYSGILQLSLLDTIGITVIGVLDTIMPDGSSGFSFLLIITFTLPPIELGFGFTLNGVGGLGGVNRTMDTNALQAGFRAHTLDSIMFPVDPIANSAQIISNIRSFFPIAVGRYLFGPLLQIGWGEPTLITFTLGVILSVPDPIVIAILGLIDAGLPTEDEALLELHIEVLGIVNFGTKILSIDGSMYDSSILIYALAGDLALRLSWGSNPNFLYSLGGFNPNFNTNGLNIPQMARLSVSIGDGDNPRISSDSYFAVTSNTVQFGADVQAYASAGGFAIQGYLGFDVLIVISPFSFEFDFTASFDVSFDGANLLGLNVDGLIQGPTPWHFHGDASISILWWTVSASVDLTWGSSTQATIPSQPVLPDLETALQNPQSWSAALPPATTVGVSLATPSPNNKILCVHPMGTLQVKEKVVPLDLPITKYGNATPSDGTEFSIQSVQINGQTETIQTIQDYFAPGQFLTLSDADKLSNPSFEQYDAGVNIGSSAILNGQNSPRTVVYEEYYIYAPTDFSVFSRLYTMPANIHLALCAQGAGFASQVKNTGLQKYSTGVTLPAINVAEPQYLVTSVDDLSIRADIVPGGGTSYFGAKAALNTYLSANPTETGNLQIMPAHEVAA